MNTIDIFLEMINKFFNNQWFGADRLRLATADCTLPTANFF
jgi:hypothetical protein